MEKLPCEITGNYQSDKILVFLHGWPDTLRLWDETIKLLEQDHFIINISYPNYHKSESKILGQDFEILVSRIKFTIDQGLRNNEKYVNKEKTKKLLVGHDWGAFLSYQFDQKYPKQFDGMITLDVSPFFDEYTTMQKIHMLLYQTIAIKAFFIGIIIPSFGDFIQRLNAKFLGKYPYDTKYVTGKMGYLYFYLYKSQLKSSLGYQTPILLGYKPSIPVTYLYGKNKPFHFHNKYWIKKMEKQPNELIPVNSGHWIQHQHSELIAKVIRNKAKL